MNPLSILYLLVGFTMNGNAYQHNPGCWKTDILLEPPHPNYTYVIKVDRTFIFLIEKYRPAPRAEIFRVKTIDAV